jgi:uncharacterized membrane protein
MKKLTLTAGAIATLTLFQYCSSTKKAAAAPAVAKTSFAKDVHPIIQASCSPCHIQGQGKVTPLNSYASAKGEIDEIIERISKNPGDKGFMPLKHPKLPDSTIAVFAKWKADGLAE